MLEKPLLQRQAAAVSGQRPVRADDAMTWHDDRDRIGAICRAHGADG